MANKSKLETSRNKSPSLLKKLLSIFKRNKSSKHEDTEEMAIYDSKNKVEKMSRGDSELLLNKTVKTQTRSYHTNGGYETSDDSQSYSDTDSLIGVKHRKRFFFNKKFYNIYQCRCDL